MVGQLVVNLVADNDDIVRLTYIIYARELFTGPHTTHGVVGIAEDEHPRARVTGFRLQVFAIHLKAIRFVATQSQHTGHNLTTVIAHGREETVIDGRLQDDAIARLGKCLHDDAQCGHHAAGVLYPLALNRPAVPAVEPRDDGLVVAFWHMRITEHAVLHAAAQGFAYGGRCLEIHVGHPHRDYVTLGILVPFHATAATAHYFFVKIVH